MSKNKNKNKQHHNKIRKRETKHRNENQSKHKELIKSQSIDRIPSTRSTESTTAIDAFNGRAFPHEPKPRNSMLSTKYNGFVNLCGTLLSFWGLYTIYTNYKTHGHILDLSLLINMLSDFPTMIALWLVTMICTLLVVVLHWLRIKGFPERSMILPFYIVLQLALFIAPSHIALRRPMAPMLKAALSMQVCVLSMKMHSFYMTTRYILRYGIQTLQPYHDRYDYYSNNKNSNTSNNNNNNNNNNNENSNDTNNNNNNNNKYQYHYHPYQTLPNMIASYAEFLMMPTLIWEPVFPRVPRIRYVYVVREWASAVAVWFFMYLIIEQHIAPLLERAVELNLVELILQLGVPTLMIWLLGFYSVFHCLLNGVAELSRFADREFYLDWWNSTSMTDYWRLWNRPVYKWMCRHIYVESMRQVPFFNKWLASMGTFVVTAVLHEYVMANTFHIQTPLLYRPWLGLMILTQIPFLYFTEISIIKQTRWGNLLMWVGFTFGMPMIELLYVRDYVCSRTST